MLQYFKVIWTSSANNNLFWKHQSQHFKTGKQRQLYWSDIERTLNSVTLRNIRSVREATQFVLQIEAHCKTLPTSAETQHFIVSEQLHDSCNILIRKLLRKISILPTYKIRKKHLKVKNRSTNAHSVRYENWMVSFEGYIRRTPLQWE